MFATRQELDVKTTFRRYRKTNKEKKKQRKGEARPPGMWCPIAKCQMKTYKAVGRSSQGYIINVFKLLVIRFFLDRRHVHVRSSCKHTYGYLFPHQRIT